MGCHNQIYNDSPMLDPVRRKLSQKAMKELSPEVKFMLLGYDFLVTTRGAQAATPLAN